MSLIQSDLVRESLEAEDLARMNVGKRWWDCKLELIPEDAEYKSVLTKYVERIADHIRAGRGLLLHGDFSTGKTGSAVIIAKAVVLHGGTAYFTPTPELSDVKIDKTEFCPGTTVWRRMLDVDLLVLDDMGAEYGSQWSRTLVERAIRLRSNTKKAVVATTNRAEAISDVYGGGLLDVMCASMLPVDVSGMDWRKAEGDALRKEIIG